MTATPLTTHVPSADDERWAAITARAPKMAATMRGYLDQISVSLRPRSVDAADNALRFLATYLIDETRVRSVKGLRREHIEGFKVWLAARPAGRGRTLSPRTIRHRLGILRVFLERLIDWDSPDAPRSCPILQTDLPRVDDPLPRFLDDTDAAALMRTAAVAEPFDRLIIEMLARTGLRVGEFCDLEANAVVRIGASHWLKVPVGKLRNDRYLPLHPVLVELLDAWRVDHHDDTWLITRPDGRPLTRDMVGRIVKRIGRLAGIKTAVTPHRLRHTLATQAINRGMSLEAIAALLGHKSLRMTLVYARIADRKVADEYFAVTEQVEALYTAGQPALPASAEGEAMRRLRLEMQRRDLGNGYCTRPPELDCAFETVCETCVHFDTGPEFVPILLRQRDHAVEREHTQLVTIYDRLLERIEPDDDPSPAYAGDDQI